MLEQLQINLIYPLQLMQRISIDALTSLAEMSIVSRYAIFLLEKYVIVNKDIKACPTRNSLTCSIVQSVHNP